MRELRDKDGLTEEEYLATYDPYRWKTPSVTADIAIFAYQEEQLKLLLVKRGNHPYLGCWALPGGFANMGEDLLGTAQRELLEETGVMQTQLIPVEVFSKPDRDPRGWTISELFMAKIDIDQVTVQAGDDAAMAVWFDVSFDAGEPVLQYENETIRLDGTDERLAFDHADQIRAAYEKYRSVYHFPKEEAKQLDQNARKAMYIHTAILTVIGCAALFGVCQLIKMVWDSRMVDIGFWIVVALAIVNLLVSPWFRSILYRYLVTEDMVYIREGYINIKEHFVPMERIQNISGNQGPIDRGFDIGTVTVTTAGGEMKLKNIRTEKTERIATYLRKRTSEVLKENDAE